MTTLLAHLAVSDLGLAFFIYAIGIATGLAVGRLYFARSK